MKFTTESFIEAAKAKYGNKYNYQEVVYKNIKTKVRIICPEHGLFEQSPERHLYGVYGCPQCAGNQRLTAESFVERSVVVHEDRYDYSHVKYTNNKCSVEIICPEESAELCGFLVVGFV